jgi:eukaryotic-like serine/threonine-protein kinase
VTQPDRDVDRLLEEVQQLMLRDPAAAQERLQALGDPAELAPDLRDRVRLETARLQYFRGELAQAEPLLRGLIDTFHSRDQPLLEGRAVRALAVLRSRQGDHAAAGALNRRALPLFVRAGDLKRQLHTELGIALDIALVDLDTSLQMRADILRRARAASADQVVAKICTYNGRTLQRQGAYIEALEAFDEAVTRIRSAGTPRPLLLALVSAASASRLSGDLEGAEERLQEAAEVAKHTAAPSRGHLHNQLGELARARGDTVAALGFYRSSLQHHENSGHRLNMALAYLILGRFDEAEATFPQIFASFPSKDGLAYSVAKLISLPLLAHRQDWAEFDRVFDVHVPILERNQRVEMDLVLSLRHAARLCEQQAEHGRGSWCRSMALDMLLVLDHPSADDERAALLAARKAGAPICLGPFDLHDVIGDGGNGEVWRGEDRRSGLPIAVKVLWHDRLSYASLQAALHTELRAITALDHDHIVVLLNTIPLSPAAAAMSDGRLAPGHPCMIFELASGGSLAESPPGDWAELKQILVALLSALAHAHARGVLHLDVKPANLLRPGAADARPGFKLGDFGLAHLISSASKGIVGGTPSYMAPEQFRAAWREYGPWTDLYGAGCTAWSLATSRPPFGSGAVDALAFKHASMELPPFRPRFSVPEGLSAWLARLLRKSTQPRFTAAADALAALHTLGAAEANPHAAVPSTEAEPTQHTFRLEALEPLPDPSTSLLSFRIHEPQSATPRTLTSSGRSLELQRAGLDLFDLRRARLVGRIAERDALWRLLQASIHTQTGRVAALVGRQGVGRSRLAAWVAERAVEAGMAQVLWAPHSPGGPPAEGLGHLVAHLFRTNELSGEPLLAHLKRSLGDTEQLERDAGLLAQLVVGQATRGAVAALVRVMARLSLSRPLVVVADDADASAVLHHAISQSLERPHAVLWLLTLQPEQRAPSLTRLLERPDAQRFDLAPLEEADMRSLVRDLLPLDRRLVTEVVTRTAGNPGFAVQLLSGWVHGGALVSERMRLTLRPGAQERMPADLMQAARERARLLPGSGRPGLELAAALGPRFDQEEWAAASGHPASDLAQYARLGIISREDRRTWSFCQPLLREALLDAAGVRAAAHHRAVATALQDRGAEAERIGRHLLSAHQPAKAAPQLFEALRAARDPAVIEPLLDLWQEAVHAAGTPWTDALQANSQMYRARALLNQGRARAGMASLDGFEGLDIDAAMRGRLWLILAQCRRAQGELDGAMHAYREAASPQSRPGTQFWACMGVSFVHKNAGRAGEALDALHRAGACSATPSMALAAELERISLLQSTGTASAEELLGLSEAAIEAARALDNEPMRLGVALTRLADLYRSQGHPHLAEPHYLEARDVFERDGNANVIYMDANLGLVRLLEGSYDAALRQFLEVRRRASLRGSLSLAQMMEPVILASMLEADEATWDEQHRRARAVVSTEWQDLERIADLAAERGLQSRAVALWELALAYPLETGNQEVVDRLKAKIRG